MKYFFLNLLVLSFAGTAFAADTVEQKTTARELAQIIYSEYGVSAGSFRCDPVTGMMLTTLKESKGEVCVFAGFIRQAAGQAIAFDDARVQFQIPSVVSEESTVTAKIKIDGVWLILKLTGAMEPKPGAGVHN